MKHAMEVRAQRGTGQDRAVVLPVDNGIVIAVVDGVGGTSRGTEAADAVIAAVREAVARNDLDFAALLRDLDRSPPKLHLGQAAAVVVHVTATEIRGASAGDCGAWLVRGPLAHEIEQLTRDQHKPPLGSSTRVVAFHGELGAATLVVAPDGLLAYAKPVDIARVSRTPDIAAAAVALISLAKTPAGALPDDVAVVLCRA